MGRLKLKLAELLLLRLEEIGALLQQLILNAGRKPQRQKPHGQKPMDKNSKDKTPKRQKPQRQKPKNICLTCSDHKSFQKWLGNFRMTEA